MAKVIGAEWKKWDIDKQDDLIGDLLADAEDAETKEKLAEKYSIRDELADACMDCVAKLPDGTANLSRKAAKLLFEKMRSERCMHPDAVQKIGEEKQVEGFVDPLSQLRDQDSLLPSLPYYGRVLGAHVIPGKDKEKDDDMKQYGGVSNPTVHVSLNQIRRVVNELIERYGHPRFHSNRVGA